MNFKEWFLIIESKEEKELALQLAGDQEILQQLNNEIPQNQKDTDKLLLLAAYYYSQNNNLNQIKTDIKDYIALLKNNRIPLIMVDLKTKKPPKDYLTWTQEIHGHQAEEEFKQKKKYTPSDIDFQSEKPIMTSPDGKIKVYESNSPQQCIILGKGQKFCVSQPGNTMWKSYRDTKGSTFYFVYDYTRNDELSIVVIDQNYHGTQLTDIRNKTGTTKDPFTGENTNKPDSYLKYLQQNGIDVKKLINKPKTKQEKLEDKKLGEENDKLDWFVSLTPQEKSNYIGRGHLLSNKQFDYLWKNRFMSLLEQYVKTGLKLQPYQISKIATNIDLKKNYVHNRMIANNHDFNISEYEWDLLNDQQKNEISEYPKANIRKAFELNNNKLIKYLVEKGAEIGDLAKTAAINKNIDLMKYLIDKGADIEGTTVDDLAYWGDLSLMKYLIDEKKVKFTDRILTQAAGSGNLELVKYLIKKVAKIESDTVRYAADSGNFELVKYLVDEGGEIDEHAVSRAAKSGNQELVEYLVDRHGQIDDKALDNASKSGNLELVKYLVQKGAKIDKEIKPTSVFSIDPVNSAIRSGNAELVEYLVDTEKMHMNRTYALYHALHSGSVPLVKYLVDKKHLPIEDNALGIAAREGHLDLTKYLLDEKHVPLDERIVSEAASSGNLELVKYLIDVKKAKIPDDTLRYALSSTNMELIKYLVDEKNVPVEEDVVFEFSRNPEIKQYLMNKIK